MMIKRLLLEISKVCFKIFLLIRSEKRQHVAKLHLLQRFDRKAAERNAVYCKSLTPDV